MLCRSNWNEPATKREVIEMGTIHTDDTLLVFKRYDEMCTTMLI